MLRKVLSNSLLVLGAFGLVISLLGEFTSLGKYESALPRSWEQFDPQLVIETPDLASLHRKVNALTNKPTNQQTNKLTNQPITEQEKMLIIYDVVIRRFTHSDQAKYNMFSNWPLWVMGQVYSPFIYIRQPEVLVKKGHSSLCSEQAYLLQTLAESEGIRTRAVGLNGHVVMEAWYKNDWHLYDPDLELVPFLANGVVLSLDELAKEPALVRAYYQGRGTKEYIQSIADIISTREDNSFILYWMVEKHLAYRIEIIAKIMKWLVPMIFLLLGFWFHPKKENKTCAA